MKRIALSLMTIAAVLVMAVGATQAYFTDQKVVAGNTFASTTVSFGDVSGMPVSVTGMVPGKAITKTVAFQYTGGTRADIFMGNRGNQADAYKSDFYFADKLWVTVTDHANPSAVHYNGYAKGLATDWTRLASNMSAGTRYYDVTFTLDADAGNVYQNKQNLGTEFLLYAVQTGGPIPTTIPYMTAW